MGCTAPNGKAAFSKKRSQLRQQEEASLFQVAALPLRPDSPRGHMANPATPIAEASLRCN